MNQYIQELHKKLNRKKQIKLTPVKLLRVIDVLLSNNIRIHIENKNGQYQLVCSKWYKTFDGQFEGQIDTPIGCITHDTLEECVLEMLYHAVSYGRITVKELKKAKI